MTTLAPFALPLGIALAIGQGALSHSSSIACLLVAGWACWTAYRSARRMARGF